MTVTPRVAAAIVATLLGLCGGVWLLSGEVSDTARDTTRTLAGQSTAGCRRGVADRRGLQDLNRDLAVFAAGAARKRRQEGNVATARTYESVVARALRRSRDLESRLPPALDCTRAFRAP